MQMSLFKCWLFLLWMTGIECFEKLWKPDDSFVNHKIMKIILESCYKNDDSTHPIVIMGDFRESIDESSVIKLDEFYNCDEEIQSKSIPGNMNYIPHKIIIIENSPKKLESDLTLFRRTQWWNHTALFFIIEKNAKTCENAIDMLIITSAMDILNSIYICTESNNTAALYTFNRIANYAPSPWIRKEKREHLYMFHQMLDSNIACESLHYDKTKNLHGYGITVIVEHSHYPHSYPRRTYFDLSDKSFEYPVLWIMLRSIFKSWNATARIDIVDNFNVITNRFARGTADISIQGNVRGPSMKDAIPTHIRYEFTAIGKLEEVSPLMKIRQSWSSSVLVVAVTVLATLIIMLTIQNRNFSIPVLDIILHHTFITANNRNYQLKICFTTMLIFIVITYGVVQGFIVRFSIKTEKVNLPKTFVELSKLGYTIVADHLDVDELIELCPQCAIRLSEPGTGMGLVQNKPHHMCLKWTYPQGSLIVTRNWGRIEESLTSQSIFFLHRQNWPLKSAFAKKVLRILESGLHNFWAKFEIEYLLYPYQSQDAELSSRQYKPLKLDELTFAFKVLGLGLSISTIVFFIELIVAKDWKAVFEVYSY